MSTPPKQKLSVSARNLGPILSLDGELTKHSQNLIFARNGTGKSFLARALRYLDLNGQSRDISDAAKDLVSDESVDGNGAFAFSRGTDVKGALQLEKKSGSVTANATDTIFHVFSEDFVQEELRERQYEIDGEIENQISVDSDIIGLEDAQKALDKAVADEEAAASALQGQYEEEKLVELNEKAGVNKQLLEYKALSLDGLLERYADKPNPPEQSFADILRSLDSLKAIPAEPSYPASVSLVRDDDFDLGAFEATLKQVTSPSSVSDDIKKKIDTHHDFFQTGAKIVRDNRLSNCPFCEQGITDLGPKAIIDAYIAYFEDEEEKHKGELRRLSSKLNQEEAELTAAETQIARQKSRYDDLKRFVPSKKDTALDDGEEKFTAARAVIGSINNAVQVKTGMLSAPHTLPSGDLAALIANINKTIEANNEKASELKNAVEKSDEERKALQRNACEVFDREFAFANWSAVEALRTFREELKGKRGDLTALEKSSPSTDARVRVAETFVLLLKEFFADKYVFDKDKFVLRRGDHEMIRGPHRTLSDGEKTAIAFCYFIACVHRKIASNSDYRKLFLVFDDPVTSMSYDFVFAIAQTLKNLSISDKGEVLINPGKIDGNRRVRPELLILTHSSYFFNVSRANRVVKDDATFSLSANVGGHKFANLRNYVAPFEQQLEHVYRVANGTEPDHGTGNAVRSVLEAIGRFCRPDKCGSLEEFITHLAGEESFSIKSIMINSLCHGTYYDEAPTADDLTLACQETLSVVERYASGQISVIKAQL